MACYIGGHLCAHSPHSQPIKLSMLGKPALIAHYYLLQCQPDWLDPWVLTSPALRLSLSLPLYQPCPCHYNISIPVTTSIVSLPLYQPFPCQYTTPVPAMITSLSLSLYWPCPCHYIIPVPITTSPLSLSLHHPVPVNNLSLSKINKQCVMHLHCLVLPWGY